MDNWLYTFWYLDVEAVNSEEGILTTGEAAKRENMSLESFEKYMK